MIGQWLKQKLPRRLYVRAVLILLVPIVLLQLVVSVGFILRHVEGATRQMTLNLVPGINYLLEEIDAAPALSEAQAVIDRLSVPLALEMELPVPRDSLLGYDFWLSYDLSSFQVITTLRDNLDRVEGVVLQRAPAEVQVWIDTDHGLLRLSIPRERLSTREPHWLLVLIVLTGALMSFVAVMFLRNQMEPVRELSEVAAAFGKGQSLPYTPRGAEEIQAAGRAFLDMRDRIERQIEQRTLLLSGVSHDLRTPITRLRLGISMLDQNDETAALLRDLDAMEGLLNTFLDFVRGGSLGEPVATDPIALVRDVVENAGRAGRNVTLVCAEGKGEMMLRAELLARAVENLIGNAVRYGSRVEVSVALDERQLRISVADDGPGIPPGQRDEALLPFVRLDRSRNLDQNPGAGLGLAIVLDAVRSHGGALELAESPTLGGLQAQLLLPR